MLSFPIFPDSQSTAVLMLCHCNVISDHWELPTSGQTEDVFQFTESSVIKMMKKAHKHIQVGKWQRFQIA